MLTAATVLALKNPERVLSGARPTGAALLSPDDSVRPALVRALLEDAMLTPGDMPDGWAAAPASGRSPLARRYGGLLIGESCASFATTAGEARLTQYVGILPRPAPVLTGDLGRSDCERASRRDAGDRRHAALAAQAPDVLLFRRGQLVMALVRLGECTGGRDDETTAAALTAIARWTALADALA
jgi:hypothetical protein